jgi:hypothetical protein
MARGWESKSVESQMDEAERRHPAVDRVELSEEQLRLLRDRESIELSRSRILREMEETIHARRREQLRAALDHLDAQLKELGNKAMRAKA